MKLALTLILAGATDAAKISAKTAKDLPTAPQPPELPALPALPKLTAAQLPVVLPAARPTPPYVPPPATTAQPLTKEAKNAAEDAARVWMRMSPHGAKQGNVQFNAITLSQDDTGSASCPCIGIADVPGTVTVKVGSNKTAKMPADVGAECKAWDNGVSPSCKKGETPGEDNGWCAQPWCYVDPCKCNLEAPPKVSFYLPDGKWQGKALWYSYDTCGGDDYWSKANNPKAQEERPSVCSEKIDGDEWGDENCRCIAIDGQPGTNNMTIGKTQVPYSADTGSTCSNWDEGNHPDCKEDENPKWCEQKWCFVDPCSCRLPVSPKTSSYLPDASYQGRPLYYSYAACGQKDMYTATERKEACVNQKAERDCASFGKCAWQDGACLGKELVEVCSPGKIKPRKVAKKDESNKEAKGSAVQRTISMTITGLLLVGSQSS